MFLPSTYSYKLGIVSVPFSSVVYVAPSSSMPSPVTLYCAPGNSMSSPLAYFFNCTVYVGIFSSVKSAVTVSCASIPLVAVPTVICGVVANEPLTTLNSNVPLLFTSLNCIGVSFT